MKYTQTVVENDFYEPTPQEKYEYNYVRIFGIKKKSQKETQTQHVIWYRLNENGVRVRHIFDEEIK